MITTINEFRKILEQKLKNAGIDLVICDVQEQYKEYFTERYLLELNKYCEDYVRVFQIWDNNKTDKPDYIFPHQVGAYDKQYGLKLDINTAEQFFTPAMWPEIKAKIENVPNEGDLFETMYGDAWVWVDNKHQWFLIPKHLVDLFKSFVQQERKIILVGGATQECLQDVLVAMKAYNVNVTTEPKFLYSKDGSMWSNQYQPTEEDLQAMKDKEDKHLKKSERKKKKS